MKRPLEKPTPRALGTVHRDEVGPLCEIARRMGWRDKMISDVQRMGLQTVTIGRMKYVTGNAVYRFVEHLATMAADAAEEKAGDGKQQKKRPPTEATSNGQPPTSLSQDNVEFTPNAAKTQGGVQEGQADG